MYTSFTLHPSFLAALKCGKSYFLMSTISFPKTLQNLNQQGPEPWSSERGLPTLCSFDGNIFHFFNSKLLIHKVTKNRLCFGKGFLRYFGDAKKV